MNNRDNLYSHEHSRSQRRKMAPPKDLLAWFLVGYRAEMPDRLHSRGVWRDAKRRGDLEGYEPVGGSHLGAPRISDAFRAWVEDDPFATQPDEYEGHKSLTNHYKTPMKAAIARLSGRGSDLSPYVFMARALYRTALRDGDWDGACASLGICEPVRRVYIETALHRLYDRFQEEPRTYSVREDAA